jgi:DNA-directed RNA polymerase beta' subunit
MAGAPEIIIDDYMGVIPYHVTTFFDNSISQIPRLVIGMAGR